ncbi:MAG: helix-turn-helix transcriptional regulator [Halothermotrichaceae bacterium]
MAKFKCNLKKYRQLADLTQKELAKKVNVRRETIVRLEAEKYNPSLKLAIDISRVVNTPIEDIFDYK